MRRYYDPTRAYQSQLQRQQEQRRIAIVFYRNGVKAAVKAARELIEEGLTKTDDIESLVLRRIEEHRKCRTQNNIDSNRLHQTANLEVRNPET